MTKCIRIHAGLTMHLTHSIPFLTLLPALITALAPIHGVYETSNGTWLECLAVRAYDFILLTMSTSTSTDLWLIYPFTQDPTADLLHRFSGLYTVGITETAPVKSLLQTQHLGSTGSTPSPYRQAATSHKSTSRQQSRKQNCPTASQPSTPAPS